MTRCTRHLLIAVVLLLAMYFQMMGSIRMKSVTYDEQEYFTRGYTILKTGDMRLRLRHPILTNIISAAPMLLVPDLVVPTDHPSWANAEFHAFSAEFLWNANIAHADLIVYLCRWPMMLLTLVLVAFVYRWAKILFDPRGALVALALMTFDPNIIAHGRLANTDIGATTFIFIAAFSFWTYLQRPDWRRLVGAGIACGLAQTTRFTALMLFPIFTLEALAVAWFTGRDSRWHRVVRAGLSLLAVVGLTLVTIWMVYGFTWGPVDGSGPSLPAPDHWGELVSLLHRLNRSDPAFLLGRVYTGGWWPYFFVVFAVKTPIGTLILVTLATISLVRTWNLERDLALLLPVTAYFGSAVVGSLNTGYRLILPVLPFLAVHAARVVDFPPNVRGLGLRVWRHIVGFLVVTIVASSLVSYPHYLAYFNGIVRPDNGYKVVVDSNVDWGQDLPGLRKWMETEGVEQVYLSWFGIAPPEHYGIHYQYLPGWPPFENADLRIYHPERPLPGIYAISVTNLQGVLLDNHDTFAGFRNLRPLDQIGHSIKIYEIPAEGPPENLALGNVRLDQIPPETLDRYFDTNDLHLRWFNPQTSLVLMGGSTESEICYVLSLDSPFADRLAEILSLQLELAPGNTELPLYKCPDKASLSATLTAIASSPVYREPTDTEETEDTLLVSPVHFDNILDFLGYDLLLSPSVDDPHITLVTYWKVQKRPKGKLQIFAHLVDSQDNIIGQHDGLDIPPTGWYPNDVLIQLHTLPLPEDLPSDAYRINIGLYDPETMVRLRASDSDNTPVGSHIVLGATPAQAAPLR